MCMAYLESRSRPSVVDDWEPHGQADADGLTAESGQQVQCRRSGRNLIAVVAVLRVQRPALRKSPNERPDVALYVVKCLARVEPDLPARHADAGAPAEARGEEPSETTRSLNPREPAQQTPAMNCIERYVPSRCAPRATDRPRDADAAIQPEMRRATAAVDHASDAAAERQGRPPSERHGQPISVVESDVDMNRSASAPLPSPDTG